ncbi:MAG: hypothetical protein ACI8WB_001383 [Phenylobacterium sp.]|jgi:hypothetical protein
MELSKISTIVRPRPAWEATDLGFKMASRWFKPLLQSWLMITLPLFVVLQWLLVDYGPVAALIIWWLKPLIERIQLGYLSFRLFGEESTLKQLFKRWTGLVGRQWLASLLWRRFSLHRSYVAPITQLENLSGVKRQQRLRVFRGDDQQAAFWLTLVCIHLESFISMATYALMYFLLPEQSTLNDTPIVDLLDISTLTNVIAYSAMAVVSPFYVAGGFSLYLNQRTRSEGWDIEITFRQMVERQAQKPHQQPQQQQHKPSAMAKVAPLLLLCLFSFSSPDGFAADEEPQTSAAQQQAKERAETILASDTFNQTKSQKVPEFILDWQVNQNDEAQRPTVLPDWLMAVLNVIAGSVEIILTALVLGLLLLLAYNYRDWLKQLISNRPPSKTATPETPDHVFGLDISQDHMPDDPAAHARQLWQQGKQRQALSLLYRGSLLNLIRQQHLTLYDGFTEGECVSQVSLNAQPHTAEYFSQLTRHWQGLAYAGIIPPDTTMQGLFEQWHHAFVESTDAS